MNLGDALSPSRWRTKRELAALCGVSAREVEAAVEAARKRGELAILSGPDGYRLATTPAELEANIATRHHRIVSQALTLRGEKRLLRRWRERTHEQPTLWESAA